MLINQLFWQLLSPTLQNLPCWLVKASKERRIWIWETTVCYTAEIIAESTASANLNTCRAEMACITLLQHVELKTHHTSHATRHTSLKLCTSHSLESYPVSVHSVNSRFGLLRVPTLACSRDNLVWCCFPECCLDCSAGQPTQSPDLKVLPVKVLTPARVQNHNPCVGFVIKIHSKA